MVSRILLLALSSSGCSLLGLDSFPCDPGGELVDGVCRNVNECLNLDTCGQRSGNVCTDDEPFYSCECATGFLLATDGRACIAVEAELATLEVTSGELSPAFDPAISEYTISGDAHWRNALIATVEHPELTTISIDDQPYTPGERFVLEVREEPRPFEIVVTTTAGFTQTYTITVDARRPPTFFKAADVDFADAFGVSVALSADGTVLAVGMDGESSSARGVDGDFTDESMDFAGAVYVFRRGAAGWVQEAYLKASNTEAADYFGISVALSADGSVLTVGATGEDSGVVGSQSDNSLDGAGAVYVFRRSGTTWAQEAYLKAGIPGLDDAFGAAVDLSGDGTLLAVGAPGEDSSAAQVDGDEANDAARGSGAVYLFRHDGTSWRREAYVKGSTNGFNQQFGASLALSADGATMAVGAPLDSSMALDGGSVTIFRDDGAWAEEVVLHPSVPAYEDLFGFAVALDADGTTLAVGASDEDSDGSGIGTDPDNQLAPGSGAVYVFQRRVAGWEEEVFIKALDSETGDAFGYAVALSADGTMLAATSGYEDSGATGWNGLPSTGLAEMSGAVFLLVREEGDWVFAHYLKPPNTTADSRFGWSLALSDDGNRIAAGTPGDVSTSVGIDGPLRTSREVMVAGAVFVY